MSIVQRDVYQMKQLIVHDVKQKSRASLESPVALDRKPGSKIFSNFFFFIFVCCRSYKSHHSSTRALCPYMKLWRRAPSLQRTMPGPVCIVCDSTTPRERERERLYPMIIIIICTFSQLNMLHNK